MMYEVYAKYDDRNNFLGIAEGESEDITAFFDRKKCYGIILKEIKIIKVPKGTAKKVEEIKKRQRELEEEQAKLENELAKNSC